MCSISYRISPQYPFPAALYDVFVAYLSLIYPPPDSFHTPISACSIVLAGDSTGGALCLVSIQLLHYFRRIDVTQVPFHDSSVPLLPPAGDAVLSAYCDHTDAVPSYINTSNVDYSGQPPIYNAPGFPACFNLADASASYSSVLRGPDTLPSVNQPCRCGRLDRFTTGVVRLW